MLSIILSVIEFTMTTVGLCFLFPKHEGKIWWSFVPVYRDFKLAQCADEEDEGRVLCMAYFLYNFFDILDFLFVLLAPDQAMLHMMATMLYYTFLIIYMIYSIRVFLGLIEVYGRKKLYIILFLLFPSIGIILFGVLPMFQPRYSPFDEDHSIAIHSGYEAETLEKGVTININKRVVGHLFRKKKLLEHIHLNIKPGRMVLLLGGSGAGKTTFINAVTGYEKADAQITLNGHNVYKDYNKLKYQIGMVPQKDLIRYEDTVYRTIADAAELRLPTYTKHAEKKERVKSVMDLFGLGPVKNNIVGKQSGGQKKRISIACEFIADPFLFILDEPDSGLDGIMARELMEKLSDIAKSGRIVIVITHTPDRVIDLFDDVIVLAKDNGRTGRLVFYGEVDEAKTFFEAQTMEQIVRKINRVEEGGEGRADELIVKYGEWINGSSR